MSKETADFDMKKLTRSVRSCSARLLKAVAVVPPPDAYAAAKHAVIELAALADETLLKAPAGLKQRPRTDADRALSEAYKERSAVGKQIVAALDPVSRVLVDVNSAHTQAVTAHAEAEELLALVKALLLKVTELENTAVQVQELTDRATFAEERLHETLESAAGTEFQMPRPLICPYLGSDLTPYTDTFIVHHSPESVRSRLKFVVDEQNSAYGIAVLGLLTGSRPLMTVFRFDAYNELCATVRVSLDPCNNSADALFVYRAVCAMALGFADAIVDQFGALDTVLALPDGGEESALLQSEHLSDIPAVTSIEASAEAAPVPESDASAPDDPRAQDVASLDSDASAGVLSPEGPDAQSLGVIVDSAEFAGADRLDARDIVPPDDGDARLAEDAEAGASGFRPFDAFEEEEDHLDDPVHIPGEFGEEGDNSSKAPEA